MTLEEIAETIFRRFEVGESATIKGYELVNRVALERGAIVVDHLRNLDLAENTELGRRIERVPKNSIGGPLRNKVFRWRRRMTEDNFPAYAIWRIQ